MKNLFLLIIVLSFISLAGVAQNIKGKGPISTLYFADSLQTNKAIVLLDVRTPDEFIAGHLKKRFKLRC